MKNCCLNWSDYKAQRETRKRTLGDKTLGEAVLRKAVPKCCREREFWDVMAHFLKPGQKGMAGRYATAVVPQRLMLIEKL